MLDGRGKDDADADSHPAPGALSGEFASRALEAAFAWERQDDAQRHARLLMIVSAALNTLLLAGDWRFYGTAHFHLAIFARLVTIGVALACLLFLMPARTPRGMTVAMAAWMAFTGAGVAVLVTTHSSIALFVVLLLPLIYYLVVPAPFAVVAVGGIACSIAMFLGYGEYATSPSTAGGLALALLVLNCALLIVVGRANRLERMQWLATRSERRIAAALAESRETLERMFAASPIPMVVTDRDTGHVVEVNDSLRAFVGGDPMAEGGTLESYYLRRQDRELLLDMIDRDGRIEDAEMEVRLADGSIRTVLVKANAVMTPHGRRIMAGIIDISDRKAVERALEWMASTDALTGLPNRHSFLATARMEMARARRTREPLALLMIDLDHFKQINDSRGHQAGDDTLRAFSALCLQRLRDEDSIGRLGGEEFAILLPGCDARAAIATADRLCAAVGDIRLERLGDSGLTISIGVTTVLPDEADLDPAIARADRALYIAKRNGRNRAVLLEEPSELRVAS